MLTSSNKPPRTRRADLAPAGTHPSGPAPTDLRKAVLCATDASISARISDTLSSAGYQVLESCRSIPELFRSASTHGAPLAVLAVDADMAKPQPDLLRSRARGVRLIAVVPPERAADWTRLVAGNEVDALVLTDEVERVLVPALGSVLADQLFIPAAARSALAGPVLSHREKQVLSLLLAGLRNNEIASRLYLSESTVKSHLSSSFRKLGVSSRAEVFRWAQAHRSDSRVPPPEAVALS